MKARGIKRKFRSDPPLAYAFPSSASPVEVAELGEASADLESSQDSTKSYLSDAVSGAIDVDDVKLVSRCLAFVAAKEPEAVRRFIRCLSPETVARSLDWDLLDNQKLRKNTQEIYSLHQLLRPLTPCSPVDGRAA
uniref:Uncharacterized protein n=1 Tax=Oryza punctata TaxID=4537 RepID=A0A0E0LZE9_ORYPU